GALEPLLPALLDRETEVRCAAAEALGAAHDPRAADALSRALLDASPEVQLAASVALGNLGDPRGEEPLLRWLARLDGAGDDGAWGRVIRGLATLGSARARSALQARLSDGSATKRTAVVEELARARSSTERALLSRDCD